MPILPAPEQPFVRSIKRWHALRAAQALLVALAIGSTGQVQATTCAGAGVLTQAMLPINNQALVCSGTNDMSSTSVPGTLCGSGATGSYKDGNEALYRFTPTVTGQYLVTISSFSSWTAIMVYDGCPTNNLCIGTISSSANGLKNLAVNLTAGTTYYIWFDLWPVPSISPCPGTFFLKLQAAALINNEFLLRYPSPQAPNENCTAAQHTGHFLEWRRRPPVVAEGPAMRLWRQLFPRKGCLVPFHSNIYQPPRHHFGCNKQQCRRS
jgi:hypothetical protein